MTKKKILIALGGNALGDTPWEQRKAIKVAVKSIVGLIKQGHQVIITHGNGPQVGMISLAFLEGNKTNSKIPSLNLSTASSMSQGYIGLDLQNELKNELIKQKINKDVVYILTQTIIDKNDKAYLNPTKPIGIYYSKKEAIFLGKKNGWKMSEEPGKGWRRVVASPLPIDIVEKNIIKKAIDSNLIVITGGGGGVPTIINKDKTYQHVEGIVDKDFTSQFLAKEINVDIFMILTEVDGIYLNFNKPNQERIKNPTVSLLEKLIKQNQFPKGSMLPKVQACIEFIKSNPNKLAAITSLKNASKIFQSKENFFIKK